MPCQFTRHSSGMLSFEALPEHRQNNRGPFPWDNNKHENFPQNLREA